MAESFLKPIRGAVNITYGPYNGYVYFFHTDHTYSRFNRLTCELEYYAYIREGWAAWPEHWGDFESVVSWDNQYLYFLREGEYTSYNLLKSQHEGGAQPVAGNWPNWPETWLNRVDTGVYWGYHIGERRRKAYFFRDGDYIRYDIESNQVEQGPLSILAYWPGWPQHWEAVWGGVDWGNGKVYFFWENEYLRYDKFRDRVDAGYPRPLAGFLEEQQDKLAREQTTLLFEEQVPEISRETFVAAVRELAAELNIRPNWLMASMWTESGLKPHAIATSKLYVGLHQLSLQIIYADWGKAYLPTKYPHLFSGQEYKQLTAEAKQVLTDEFVGLEYDQLQYVGNWLRKSVKSFKWACRSFDQLRLIGFGGLGLGEPDRALLASVVPKGNPRYDLSKDGQLTVAEFRAAVFDIMDAKFKASPSNPKGAAAGLEASSKLRHDLG